MPESPTESAPGTWSVPECPFTIAYVPEVMDDIRLAVMDAFFSLPRGGAEIGGILLGWHTQRRVTVADHVALDCEHAMGPSFVLSPRDETRLRELLDKALLNPEALQPVGWYHSHTRSDIFLSDADLEIHRRFFPEAWQVALVLKPHTFQPMRGGFFFREPDGSVQSTVSYQEFELEAMPLRPVPSGDVPVMPEAASILSPRQSDPPRTAIDVSAAEISPRAALTLAAEPPAPEMTQAPLEAPRFATVSSEERSWLWLRAILALSLGLVVGAVAVQTRQIWKPRLLSLVHSSTISPASLALSTLDQDGQLQIRWDGLSPAVAQASSGLLSITDGGLIGKEVHLDLEHLKSGVFTYGRESGQVDVVLAVHESDGPTLRAVAAFVGKTPTRPALAASLDNTRPAPGDGAQIAKLKRDLAGQVEQVKKVEKLLADQSLLVSSATKMKQDLAAQIERNKKLEKSLSDAQAQTGEAAQLKKDLAAANERNRRLDSELKQQQRKRMGAQDPGVAK